MLIYILLGILIYIFIGLSRYLWIYYKVSRLSKTIESEDHKNVLLSFLELYDSKKWEITIFWPLIIYKTFIYKKAYEIGLEEKWIKLEDITEEAQSELKKD